jgi:hypothetical protein
MYQLNGNAGVRAATAASDEFLAMIGDYYKPGMSHDALARAVRDPKYGIDISDKLGSTLVSSKASRWSAKESKNATAYWWSVMDIDNNTLLTKRQQLAKANYSPFTQSMRSVADNNEIVLRDVLRSAGVKDVYQEGNNAPFDVWIGADPKKYYAGTSKQKPTAVIEVKTIITSKNNKVTMRADALARKKNEWEKFGKKRTSVHTVIFDERTGKYYYRNDVGSFRLASMEEVTLDDLARKFGGKSTTTSIAPETERISEIQSASPKIKTKAASSIRTKEVLEEGNTNEVRIVTVGTGKKKYIFKPIEGETYFAKEDKAHILTVVNRRFKTANVTRLEDLTEEHWEYLEKLDILYYEQVMRQSIDNFDVSLSQREAFALDVGQRLGFDNEYGKLPKFLIAENDDGSVAGVLIEFIEGGEVESMWNGVRLTQEERYQMAVFDYLIGNLDRHDANWMRLKDGKPVYIDHGYSMPGQALDMGGLTELRLYQAQEVYEGMEYDMDADWLQGLAVRVQNFVDNDATTLARSYGFNADEIDAMLRRGDSVAERIRAGNFSYLLKSHVDDFGMYGVEDSYIGG